jgi:carboxylesterase
MAAPADPEPQPEHAVLPGAEPWSHGAGPAGVLVCHGFTGNPTSMRGVADAMADAGLAVELPRLPGHGTHPDDMVGRGWADWTAAAEEAYQAIAGRCERVAVVGLSMGASLCGWLAARHPEIRGLVAVNGLFDPGMAEVLPLIDEQLANGVEATESLGSDIAAPGAVESSYPVTPLRGLKSLLEGVAAMAPDLRAITCPVLVMTSPQDHVVPPASSDLLAASVRGPVERVTLEHSYHVATLDHDGPLVVERAVAFVLRVTAA